MARGNPGRQPRIYDENDPVRTEIRTALAHRIRIIPILADETEMLTADQLPGDIRGLPSLNAAYLQYRSFNADLEALSRSISRIDLCQVNSSPTARDGRASSAQARTPAVATTPRTARPAKPQVEHPRDPVPVADDSAADATPTQTDKTRASRKQRLMTAAGIGGALVGSALVVTLVVNLATSGSGPTGNGRINEPAIEPHVTKSCVCAGCRG